MDHHGYPLFDFFGWENHLQVDSFVSRVRLKKHSCTLQPLQLQILFIFPPSSTAATWPQLDLNLLCHTSPDPSAED
jgi:hypothetical protein